MPSVRFGLVLVLFGSMILAPGMVWADLPAPVPFNFLGGRQNIPEGRSLIAFGLTLSAVVIAGGMITSRMLHPIKATSSITIIAAILIALIAYQVAALQSYRDSNHVLPLPRIPQPSSEPAGE